MCQVSLVVKYSSCTLDKQKVSEYKQEGKTTLTAADKQKQQNTYSHKTSGRQLKQSNYHSLPRQGVDKNRKNT